MADFVHLHVHSEYSLLDGLTKIKDLVKAVKSLGMRAVALTDHGAMYGVIEFYKECRGQGIKPLIGMEGYLVPHDHRVKDSRNKDNHHVVLIAKNAVGYRNLMKLTTIGHLEGYYYRPRVDKETVKRYSEGLICLSACPKGEIGQLLLGGNKSKVDESLLWYQEVFGEDGFYLEIQRHNYRDYLAQAKDAKTRQSLKESQELEDRWVAGLVQASRDYGIPLVATNDVHYLKKEDAFAQDVLVCISTGKMVNDIDRLRYVDTPSFYLQSEEEVQKLFADLPDAVANTKKVADAVELEIELGAWLFPSFEIPKGKGAAEYLTETTMTKLKTRYLQLSDEIIARVSFELEVIIKKGYAPYFLMMADMVNWCTERGIITNTRGSAAGSLVSYALGITVVDPLRYGLPFERFLNPFRPKPPDIDLDVADNRREELLKYINDRYGQDKVAQICTFGRMLARAAVRDVGRVLGHPYSVPDRIAKLIPLGSQGFPMTVKHALEISPELRQLADSEPRVKGILVYAEQIEGNARHASVHAAGIVVSPGPMTDYSPLQLEPNGNKVITQYEMHACEDVGLVKFDILGIRNLSILAAAVEIVEKIRQTKIDLAKIPLDDRQTFAMLARGETMGVFQLGGSGMTKWLKELRPNRIEDIMVMIALFRPGPMANIPEYIARKNKKSPVVYLHPKMANYLEKSYGILVYQEDVLFTALELAGYNWETVDKLRNAIGKKIPAEMAKQQEIFVNGCQSHSGLSAKEAEKLWELFVPFQGYGFNKAHAASYGLVSYQTAYMKAHYPVEYMAALMTAESGDTDKIVEALEECRRKNIVVLPPDIESSEVGFAIEKNEQSLDQRAIRFGLNAIKNVGGAALEEILKARKAGRFENFCDFYLRVNGQKVNKKVLESLIKAGAMDRFGRRAAMLAGLDNIRAKCELVTKQKNSGQRSLFAEANQPAATVPSDDLPPVAEFEQKQLMQLEKELLGLYLTSHPLSAALSTLASEVSTKIASLKEELTGLSQVRIGGVVASSRVVTTKKNNSEMAFVSLEDETGKVELVVFPKVYAANKQIWERDQVVVVEGKVDQREEELAIIVDRAKLVEEKSDRDFTIRIPQRTSSATLLQLNQTLKDNPGDQKGRLLFVNGPGNVPRVLDLNFGVDYRSEIRQKIESLLEK